MIEKYQREFSEINALLVEEGNLRQRLQMELDAKESENEQLLQKLALNNSDTVSVCSGQEVEGEDGFMGKNNALIIMLIVMIIDQIVTIETGAQQQRVRVQWAGSGGRGRVYG